MADKSCRSLAFEMYSNSNIFSFLLVRHSRVVTRRCTCIPRTSCSIPIIGSLLFYFIAIRLKVMAGGVSLDIVPFQFHVHTPSNIPGYGPVYRMLDSVLWNASGYSSSVFEAWLNCLCVFYLKLLWWYAWEDFNDLTRLHLYGVLLLPAYDV